jgi:hypothetical protein
LAQVEQDQQEEPLDQTVQILYLVLLPLQAAAVVVTTMVELRDQAGHQVGLVEAEMVAGQPLEARELQGKAMLEEMVLAQSLVLTPSVQAEVVEQAPLESPEHHLQVKAAQDFAPQ